MRTGFATSFYPHFLRRDEKRGKNNFTVFIDFIKKLERKLSFFLNESLPWINVSFYCHYCPFSFCSIPLFFRLRENKDKNVHRFAIRGKLLWRERERETETQRQRNRERERERENRETERDKDRKSRICRDLLCKYKKERIIMSIK